MKTNTPTGKGRGIRCTILAALLALAALTGKAQGDVVDMPPADEVKSVSMDMPPPTPETAQAPPPAPSLPAAPASGQAPPSAPATPYTQPERSEEELLILKMTLGSLDLSDAILGYPNQGSLLLPLSDVVGLFDFPIEVDPENGRAEGWFIEENRLFSLDLSARQVVIAGESRTVNPAYMEQLPDDIYVDVRELAVWFPVDIEFDLPNLIVDVTSREPLPIEARLLRDQRREKALSQRRTDKRDLKEVEVPYEWITWPVSDTTVNFTVTSGDDGPELTRSFTTLATADLAKLNADIFLSGDDTERLSIARLKLGRQSTRGDLLGDIEATQFAVGDIFAPQVTHVSRTALGRGAFVSNEPIGQQVEFDRITLQGDLQLGWEVELYRNEVLLDFRQSQTDGRYLFEDVPLLFGVNVLKLVFYGPQGQRREEIQQLRIGSEQIKPGEHLYAVSANQQDSLLLLGDKESLNTDGFQGKSRMTAEYKYGLSKEVSVGANFASIPFEGGHRSYGGASMVASLGPVYTRADVTKDIGSGWAGTLSAQTNIFGVTVLGEHTYLNDFLSEEFSDEADPLESESRLRLDGVLRGGFLPHIPYALTVNHSANKSRDRSTELQNRLSTAIGPASVTSTLSLAHTDPAESDDSTSVSGSLQIGGRIGAVRTRGQISYAINPEAAINSAALSGDWRLSPTLNARAGINKELTGSQKATYSMGVSADVDYVALGVDGQYDDLGEYALKMQFTYSWGKDAADGGLRVSSRPTAERGTMTVKVFRDLDGDGAFTDGVDEPLEGVGFRSGRAQLPQKTNAQGLAFVTGLDTYNPVPFEVDIGTLEDPFWVAAPEAVKVSLRPGVPGEMAFAVISTGEIDGVVYRRDGDWSEPVSDVRVQLVDMSGDVVKEVRSQYDGFYLLDFLRPGRYTLRIDPEQLARLKLPDVPVRAVEIGNDGTILGGEDFVIGGALETEAAFRARLAAFETQAAAEAAWAEIGDLIREGHDGIRPTYQDTPAADGSGTVVHLFAGPFTSRTAAGDACTQLRAEFGNTWCNPQDIQAQ